MTEEQIQKARDNLAAFIEATQKYGDWSWVHIKNLVDQGTLDAKVWELREQGTIPLPEDFAAALRDYETWFMLWTRLGELLAWLFGSGGSGTRIRPGGSNKFMGRGKRTQ